MNNRNWDQSRKELVSPHTCKNGYYKTKQRRTKNVEGCTEIGTLNFQWNARRCSYCGEECGCFSKIKNRMAT